MAITEFSFSVDEFRNPKVYKDAEAICELLTRLLLLEPGTYQSHPEMGVGLVSRYLFAKEGAAEDIKNEFEKQIGLYLPRFQGAQVTAIEKDKTLIIGVQIDNNLYSIYYDKNTASVPMTDFTSLSDL